MRRTLPAKKEVGGGRLTKGDSGLFLFVHSNTCSSLFNKLILSPSWVADLVPGTGETAMNESQSLPSKQGFAKVQLGKHPYSVEAGWHRSCGAHRMPRSGRWSETSAPDARA